MTKHTGSSSALSSLKFRVESEPPEFVRPGFTRSGKFDAVVAALSDLDFSKWVVVGPFAEKKDAELGRNLRQVKGIVAIEKERGARLVTRIAQVKGGWELWLCWMRLDKPEPQAE